ncbi:gliding motility-associated C-terminal domain-containing protein/prepilin-type processing-associated H-X9-DG domain-containing protein [Tenacibaculum sp. MAR_2009_124]|nr:gliding motility-associated C-terminal domain-containing protein/prepilin-type processing-associated H-X9-DG domain-containing protein [Tenacibaculum sp. MAR_2009_124]
MTNEGQFTVLPDTPVSILSDFQNTNSGNIIQNGEVYFHKNYNNEGQYTYNSSFSKGTSHFIGSSIQQILSSNMSIFYKILFNNSTSNHAFNLIGELYIENESTFNLGIIEGRTSTDRFIFGEEGRHINTSNNSFVDGSVEKLGTTNFNFPVGANNYYRRLSISNPNNTDDLFLSEYYNETSNTQYPHSQKEEVIEFIDNQEYWTLIRKNGNSNIFVTLTWNENTTSSQILSGDLTELHVVRWDIEKQEWIDEGGIVNEQNKEVTTIASVENYGVFTLARVKQPVVVDCLTIYNYITPNSDGVNDVLKVECIENYPNNSMEIFNRWGNQVYYSENYNNLTNVFRGFSDGRATIKRSDLLPTGTYFYIFKFVDNNSQNITKTGWVYLH